MFYGQAETTTAPGDATEDLSVDAKIGSFRNIRS